MENNIDYKKLVEAALFMSPNAMDCNELSKATGIASIGMVENIVQELIKNYINRDTSLEISQINNKYMFSLKEPYAAKVSHLATGPDISRAGLRILAYISRDKEILQSNIIKAFGSSAYEYIKELTEKEFIETKKFKRTKKLFTTQKFKEYFNVN